MPKALKGTLITTNYVFDQHGQQLIPVLGTLVKCDASIKAMIMDIDNAQGNDMIVEDLDDEHVLVKDNKVAELKQLLTEKISVHLREPETSDSEGN
ncbi:hypothetical protein GQ43DRAFT_275538 [Delitschia confertaspora ATCC 74209]|uniref:General transcription and DNA repair factor IIH subunit TFB5 n=1 Tax=Delitschia confertaspora ATCC 74209 TaxID=1513339 RepID=A0A9P4JGL3_9PLEO|nr:hypothetical protein GQ43DRAFT_275538 [Delitschia confertaspora ATCC 74209]